MPAKRLLILLTALSATLASTADAEKRGDASIVNGHANRYGAVPPPIGPRDAFDQLVLRTFGNKRVKFTNPKVDAKAVAANITFVPTKWTAIDVQTQEEKGDGGFADANDHALTERLWTGPLLHSTSKSSNPRGKSAGSSTSSVSPSSTATTKVEYSCPSPQQLVIYASTASEAGYALHHYLRHFLASSVAWGVDGTGYNIVIPEEGLPVSCEVAGTYQTTGGAEDSFARRSKIGQKKGGMVIPDTERGAGDVLSHISSNAKKNSPPNRKGQSSDASAKSILDSESSSASAIYIESVGQYRYYYNVCTFGYTSAFWDWEDRWEQEIDWMALHGLNLVLMSLPTEWLWILTYTNSFGVSAADATAYFSGPSFLPWNRMGNLHSWGGPASPLFFEQQFQLAMRLVQRMRDLGINPILPAFDGHVADAFVKKYQSQYPNDFVQGADWGGLGVDSKNWILVPSSPLFSQVGVAYMKNVVSNFGLNTFYAADTWNEMNPPSSNATFLKLCGSAVIDSIRAVDPSGVWLMQGWTFYNDRGWWALDRISDYLSGVPQGQLIVLDLTSDNNPVYTWTKGYFGHSFIWNMLHNYGGKRGLWGAMGTVASAPYATFTGGSYPSMIGVGATPEGSETNPVLYAVLFDSAWGVVRTVDQLQKEWLPMFWKARFGSRITAYDVSVQDLTTPMLGAQGAYTYIPPCCSHFVSFEQRPWLTFNSFYSSPLGVNTAYNPDSITQSLYVLLKPLVAMGEDGWRSAALSNDPGLTTYRYELVDYLRQYMGNLFTDAHFGSMAMYLTNKFPMAGRSSSRRSSSTAPYTNQTIDEIMKILAKGYIDLMADVEALVGLDDNYLLGRWLKEAETVTMPKNDANATSLFLFNAIRQITLWGPLASPDIHDYAAKQWQGLIGNFYIPRWHMFFDYIGDVIKSQGGSFPFIPSSEEWEAESIVRIEDPIAYTLQETIAKNPLPSCPTISLADAYTTIVRVADRYLPGWRDEVATPASSGVKGSDVLSGKTRMNKKKANEPPSRWQDDYNVYTNVTISNSAVPPSYSSWTGLAVSQHIICSQLLPDCTAFVPASPYSGGAVYIFTAPTFTQGNGRLTLYVKRPQQTR